jgi:hypothetical protein
VSAAWLELGEVRWPGPAEVRRVRNRREPNAAQVRVQQRAAAAVERDPDKVRAAVAGVVAAGVPSPAGSGPGGRLNVDEVARRVQDPAEYKLLVTGWELGDVGGERLEAMRAIERSRTMLPGLVGYLGAYAAAERIKAGLPPERDPKRAMAQALEWLVEDTNGGTLGDMNYAEVEDRARRRFALRVASETAAETVVDDDGGVEAA